jgi:hypothetical protein
MRNQRVARDAGTGQFVTQRYAATHPKTTVIETVKSPSRTPRQQQPTKKGK